MIPATFTGFHHSSYIAKIQDKGRNLNSFVGIWVGRISAYWLEFARTAGFRPMARSSRPAVLVWSVQPDGWNTFAGIWADWIPATLIGCYRISVPARFWWWSTAWSESRLCRLIGVECVWRLRKIIYAFMLRFFRRKMIFGKWFGIFRCLVGTKIIVSRKMIFVWQKMLNKFRKMIYAF
jgi:hypothetical protein